MFVVTPNFWTDSQFRSTICDNGFEKGPVPQLGWGRGINRTTVLKKAPSPSWAGGGVSSLSTGVQKVNQRLNGFEKVQQAVEF